jgi:multiple sugar transport system ATP-binding protein
MLDATLERQNGSMSVKLGSQRLSLGPHVLEARPALARREGQQVVLGIRPEDLQDAAHATDRPSDECLKGRVALTEALGSEIMVHFTVDAPAAYTEDVRELAKDAGDEAAAEAGASEATLVGRFDPRSKVSPGSEATVSVDTRSLHFFDPETGQGIYDQTD